MYSPSQRWWPWPPHPRLLSGRPSESLVLSWFLFWHPTWHSGCANLSHLSEACLRLTEICMYVCMYACMYVWSVPSPILQRVSSLSTQGRLLKYTKIRRQICVFYCIMHRTQGYSVQYAEISCVLVRILNPWPKVPTQVVTSGTLFSISQKLLALSAPSLCHAPHFLVMYAYFHSTHVDR